MESRERILRNLQSVMIEGDTSYPQYSHHHDGITHPDESFKRVLDDVGGECFFVKDYTELIDRLVTFDIYKSAKNVCSCLSELDKGNVDIDSVEDIHDFKNVNLGILRGEFGVGENAAVWINTDSLKYRGVLFLSENIILIIDSGKIVPDMESAYELIDFKKLKSGYFVSGPSKTADIGQCLVIGAHGAKSLIVFVIRP
jgi:L-lactate dehydrogenase complex protein LldG